MSKSQKARVDEEDDLDELDDVLQQFSKTPKSPQPATRSAQTARSPPAASPAAPAPLPDESLDDFERELMRGMEDLVRDIASEAGLDDDALQRLQKAAAEGELSAEDQEKERVLKAAWETMLLDGMNGAMRPEDVRAGPSAKASAGAGLAAPETGDSFQAGIKATMDKLKQSDSNLQADAAPNDDLSELLKQLDLGDESLQSEEDVQKALEKMMAQLMSKDILYEPLKELHEKFPAYLKDNASELSAEDMTRYRKQYAVVTKIIAEFEDPAYSEKDQKRGEKVVDLMNEMQSYGSPPTQIMGPLPPGLELGSDGLPNLTPDGCTVA